MVSTLIPPPCYTGGTRLLDLALDGEADLPELERVLIGSQGPHLDECAGISAHSALSHRTPNSLSVNSKQPRLCAPCRLTRTSMETKPVLYAEDEKDDVFFMERAFREAGVTNSLVIPVDGQHALDYIFETVWHVEV